MRMNFSTHRHIENIGASSMRKFFLPRRHKDTKNYFYNYSSCLRDFVVKHTTLRVFVSLWFITLLLSSCTDTFDVNEIHKPKQSQNFGDTTYVLQSPTWTGFNQPKDVHVGFEPFIYVADAGNNRIAMLDLAGNLIGYSPFIQNPNALTQDRKLNLLVCGEFDTTINGQKITFGAIFKLDLFAAQHDISKARVERVYFDLLSPNRKFVGISALADNSFYVARTGPNNASIVDPDDAIMLFTKNGIPLTRSYWPYLSVDGTGLSTLTQPTGLATFTTSSTDFIYTQKGSNSLFRTQWITYRSSGDVSGWESYFTPSRDAGTDFIQVNLFKQPEDVATDPAGNIFVIDAGKDSLYKFNRAGMLEQAFGGSSELKAPEGVAFFDKTLYIADTGNNRVLRYVLSTDVK